MTALIHTNSTGNIIIQLKGSLDFEYSETLHKEIEEILAEHPASKVTLDLYFLEFVGSSGIGSFVDTVARLNKTQICVELSNVKPEFMKVFKLYKQYDMNQIIQGNDDSFTNAA